MKKKYKIVEQTVCGTCKHYRRHYVRYEAGRFTSLHYGHCVYPRIKQRDPGQTCPHWTAREEPEEART